MSELEQVIESGPIEEVVTVLSRLKSLPEFGLNGVISDIYDHLKTAEMHQRNAEAAYKRSRDKAASLLKRVGRNWTPEQITAATGYDFSPIDEDNDDAAT